METGIRGAMFLEVRSLLHLPVACTCVTYMQSTEKGAQQSRRSTGTALGPFIPGIPADAAGGGDSSLAPLGK